MKRIKYFLSAILVFSLFTSMAFAAEAPLTAEDILEIQTTNEKIEQYIAENPLPRAGETKILDVPCYQQETDYWCGVACAQMVLDYCTGVKYPQSTLATLTGATTAGSGSYGICNALVGKGLNYQVATLGTTTSLSSDVRYSIKNDYPLICSVKQIPGRYTSGSGHFLVLYGYQYYASGSAGASNIYYNDPHYNDDRFGSYVITLPNLYTAITSNAGYYIRYAG